MDDSLDPRKQEGSKSSEVMNREVYYKGDTIIEQGGEGYRAYYIEKGKVAITVKEDGHDLVVAELDAGHIFGEMALINNEPRSASVSVLEETVVTVISREEIEGRIKGITDKATRALINVLAQRLRTATRGQMEHFKNLADFQERVSNLVERVDASIDDDKRDGFRAEVGPLLNDLQKVLDRYQQ